MTSKPNAKNQSLSLAKMGIQTLVLFALALFHLACSTQWREANVSLEGDEMMSYLDEVLSFNSGAPGQREVIRQLREDPRSTVYFAQSSVEFGPAVSVASLLDFTPLGVDRSPVDLQAAQVFFIDLPLEDGTHRNALIVELWWGPNDFTTHILSGEGSVLDGTEYVAFLGPQGANGAPSMVLRSYDVSRRGQLNAVIQLKVGNFDPQTGIETYWGKFSTLVGYQ